MNTKSILIFFVGAIALVACERDADIELPDVPSKLVLNCYISPGDTLAVAHLSSSNPVNKPTNNIWGYVPVQGAFVSIGDGNQWIEMSFSDLSGFYLTAVPDDFFIPGKTYFIKAEHPDFATITAQTRLPIISGGMDNIAVDFIESQGIFGNETEIRFQLNILDNEPGEYNYYRLAFYDFVEAENQDPILIPRGNHYAEDSQLSNGVIPVNRQFYYGAVWEMLPLLKFEIILLTTGEDYYRYHKTMEQGGDGGGPFSEPVIVYSNVTNGLGCFGGYIKTSVIVEN